MLLSTAVMAVLFFYGGEINQGQSLSRINNRGVEFGKWNIFTYNAAGERRDMLQAYPSYILFALELAFMVLLLFLYVKKHRPGQLYPFVCFVLLSLAWVSPLYILGADWFRWNHIDSLLLVILLLTGLHEHRKGRPRIEGRFNLALLLINLVFMVFYLHIRYDTSGNSMEYLRQYISHILPF